MDLNVKKGVKVLLVGPTPPPYGGIPAYVKSLCDAKLDGIEFILFNTAIPSWAEPFGREGQRNYGSIFEMGLWGSLKKILYVLSSYISLIFSLVTLRPSVVHVFTCSYWGYWRNWLYVLFARLFGRKTIFHLLGAIDLFYEEVGDLQKRLLRKSLNSADCYLLQSPGLEAWAKQYSRKEVIGIWNGIDFAQVPQKLSTPPALMAGLERPVGLTIGNLSINKGTPDIIAALKLLKGEGIKINWVFVGRGNLQQFRELAAQNGVAENVHFAGEVSELEKWQFLQHASFFCLPSYAEGQPISIIEAMYCGLAVISTKVGSIPEMITEDVNGKLVGPGDTQALKNAILFLARNPGLEEKMGMAAFQLCRERHDIQELYAQLSKVYFDLGARR